MSKGERTREMVLNRGMLHSSQYGLADITIGTMSKLCGLSRTGVISHFKNKDDMQIAILDYSEKQFVDTVLKPSRHEDALTQLRDLLSRWIDWTQSVFFEESTSCPFIKAIVDYEHREDSPVRQRAFEQQRRLISFLTHLIDKAKQQERMDSAIPSAEIAFELYSLYVGLTITESFVKPDNRRTFYLSVLERGLQRYERVPA